MTHTGMLAAIRATVEEHGLELHLDEDEYDTMVMVDCGEREACGIGVMVFRYAHDGAVSYGQFAHHVCSSTRQYAEGFPQ